MTPVIEANVKFASMRQINAAIERMHRGDYECAITLAGAAEGMLAEPETEYFRNKVKALAKSFPKGVRGAGPNDCINWLNHATLEPGGERVETATITLLEVIVTIWRAIPKFQAIFGASDADRTPQMIGFENWAREYLPTLDI